MTKNNLLNVIERFSTEWSVTLSIRLYGQIPSGNGMSSCNIISLSSNGVENNHYGSRVPFVGLIKWDRRLHTTSAINGNWNWIKDLPALNIDQTYHLEIH